MRHRFLYRVETQPKSRNLVQNAIDFISQTYTLAKNYFSFFFQFYLEYKWTYLMLAYIT